MRARGSEKGEVTAFLALTFVLLVSFAGGLMESASLQSAKCYRRADMCRAVESVFAEYERTLLEEYDLFALDASYGSGEYSEERLFDRMSDYGASGMEQSVSRVEFLTDRSGAAFEDQVARWIEHRYGLSGLGDLGGDFSVWDGADEAYDHMEEERVEMSGILEEAILGSDPETPMPDSPVLELQKLFDKPLLSLAVPRDRTLSEKSVTLSEASSHRERNRGNGTFADVAEEKRASKLALGEYMLTHFSEAAEEEAEEGRRGALDYELEYILVGRASDRENLEAVLKKLLAVRMIPNYAFLQTDAASRAQADALALPLAAVLAVPEAEVVIRQVILIAWAFGESILDLRSLLKGGKVPLLKNSDNWQLSLEGLLRLGSDEDVQDGADAADGMSYRDYMRGLIALGNRETMCRRCLDVVEWNMRQIYGAPSFRADWCISKIELASTVRLRRGITYRFSTYYGYR